MLSNRYERSERAAKRSGREGPGYIGTTSYRSLYLTLLSAYRVCSDGVLSARTLNAYSHYSGTLPSLGNEMPYPYVRVPTYSPQHPDTARWRIGQFVSTYKGANDRYVDL